MARLLTTSVVVWLCLSPSQAAQAGKEKAFPGVSARLEFTVKEYDPAGTRGAALRILVRNETKETVVVPAGFDDHVTIRSRDLVLMHRDTAKGKPTAPHEIKPGEEAVVLTLALDEILLRQGKDNPWRWDWMRRPPPPLSPIHQIRAKDKFLDEASFQAIILISGAKVTASEALLKVKKAEK